MLVGPVQVGGAVRATPSDGLEEREVRRRRGDGGAGACRAVRVRAVEAGLQDVGEVVELVLREERVGKEALLQAGHLVEVVAVLLKVVDLLHLLVHLRTHEADMYIEVYLSVFTVSVL